MVPSTLICKGRTFLIDSGACNDFFSMKDAKAELFNYIRTTSVKPEYGTAAENIVAHRGMRVQIAPWEFRSDVALMTDAPSLLSLGMRCLHGGMNFVWVHRRLPAFIPMSL